MDKCEDLYYYGEEIGDAIVQQQLDVHSEIILFSSGIPFGTKLHKFAHVSLHGAITFGEPHYALTPSIKNSQAQSQNIFAPFWSEVDPYYNNSHVYYHLYEMYVSNKGYKFTSPKQDEIFNRTTKEVKEFYPFGSDTFIASTVLIVTWKNIKPFSWYSWQCKNSNYSNANSIYCSDKVDVNTFQVIIASNGTTTYAITMYQTGGMKWEYVSNRVIFVGYLSDNKLTDLGLTFSRRTVTLGTDVGTAGLAGTYVELVGAADNSAQKCINFYLKNVPVISTEKFKNDMSEIIQCGCNLGRLDYQWSLVEKRNNIYCYAMSPNYMRRELPSNSLNKLCCYQYKKPTSDSWEDAQKAASESFYETGTPDSGNILTQNPFPENRILSLENDILPKNWCCKESDLCDLYNAVRPDTGCTLDSPFISASSYGDPHITTLDNKQYTLNGWAEYVMLSVPEKSFMLQARTHLAETSDGRITNATVFVAFAVSGDKDASRLQVELSEKKTGMYLFADRIDFTNDFYHSASFKKQLNNFAIQREDSGNKTKFVASFTNGITMKIFVGLKSLEITILAKNELKKKTIGLMGNFDGDPNNDFILPDGSLLTANQTDTERKLFYNFGKKWEVNDSNSVFTYSQGESPATYRHSDFVPLFLEEVKNESVLAAKAKCGPENDACIFDFLATRDDEFAKNTNTTNKKSKAEVQALNNSLPVLNLTQSLNNASQWEVTVNQVNIITVKAVDADQDTVTYRLINPDVSTNVSSDGKITFIPDDQKITIIQVQAEDDKGGSSNAITISTATCPNCHGHGDCDKSISRKTSGTYVVYACKCYPAYTGELCVENFNACTSNPCALGQNCTDLTPEQQGMNTTGYVCGPCPNGFEVKGTKCIDINECSGNQTCQQKCINTLGSYYCSCNSGYRRNTVNSKLCDEINECEENTDDCSQVCDNSPGSFECKCFPGYYMKNGVCEKNMTNEDLCRTQNCSQICFVENGEARCDCLVGYALDKDGIICRNIDECSLPKKPCSQVCTDTPGKFFCSCFAGFKLEDDRVSCTRCEISYYGIGCSKSCQCSGHGSCDSVRGCVCDDGWDGVNCNTDIDECKQHLDNCTVGEICVNTMGGFSCDCPVGYFRNKTCQDIDECSDQTLKTCSVREDCANIIGSYVCNCKAGYARNITSKECEDIDECVTQDHNCQEVCINVPGKFNCDCKYGYKLEENRVSCKLVKDVCKDFEKLNCSQGCTVDLQQNKSYCFCGDGYRLVHKEVCQDIDECESSSLNLCSYKAGCINKEPRYMCSCPPGSKLDNDGRTCINCTGDTWSINCSRSCSCSTGASRCDKILGCICKTGYTGDHCEVDIDQCSNGEVICNDRQQCLNRPGPDSCICKSGYTQIGSSCEDINECLKASLNDCQQSCVNLIGSYTCGCLPGYTYNTNTKTCDDIDECALKMDKCTGNCINTDGSYRCSCKPGFKLSRDLFTCQAFSMCANRSICQYNCANVNDEDTCFCSKGQVLNNDNRTCGDIDLCVDNACTHTCVETSDNTSISCLCPTGKTLAADGFTCDSCIGHTWGDNCANKCSCSPSTTELCNPVNGSCHCLDGWTGSNCTEDINECTSISAICHSNSNTECINSNGGYFCSCHLGYSKNGNNSCEVCSDFFYGKDCSQQCNCNSFHSTCDKTNGTCYCNKGWTGPTCDTDIDECLHTNSCNIQKNELCINTEGSFQCSCQQGFYRFKSSDCIVCPPYYYGKFCSQSCDCNSNNANSCNNVNGTCTCKSQWKGTDCTTDVDECQENTYTCPNNSHCTNNNGGYTCDCNSGYFKNTTSNTCQKIIEKFLELTFIYDTSRVNLNDVISPEYQTLKTGIEKALYKQLIITMNGIMYITVTKMRVGSLIVEIVLGYDEHQDPSTTIKAVESLIKQKTLDIGNQTATLTTLKVGQITLNSLSSLCDIKNAFDKCIEGQVCEEATTTCKALSVQNDRLTIGLAVGIPAFFLLCVLVVIVCLLIRKQTKKKLTNNDRHFHQLFAENLSKREGNSKISSDPFMNERFSDEQLVKRQDQQNDFSRPQVQNQSRISGDQEFHIPRPSLKPTTK
ncbi:hypothetical protein Btru_055750 [Bulinus truncatus]|nr:hypothetical protein Btru_055750 [Bulinus truncatus]